MWELPFEVLGRALDAIWEDGRLRLLRVDPPKKGR